MKLKHMMMAAAVAILPISANAAEHEFAPAFSLATAAGENFDLAAQKGKVVVLEWTNKDCPFVKKFYDEGHMQAHQKAAAEEGVQWVTIISSAPGKQGHLSAEEAIGHATKVGATPAHIIRDETGMLGKLYNARTTPTMVVIDEEGKIAYQGAIDSNSSANTDDIAGATNYVVNALKSLKAGTAIEVVQTKSYGCGVKYAY